jgi:hypothetical protein
MMTKKKVALDKIHATNVLKGIPTARYEVETKEGGLRKVVLLVPGFNYRSFCWISSERTLRDTVLDLRIRFEYEHNKIHFKRANNETYYRRSQE